MRPFLAAVLAAVLVSLVAMYVLGEMEQRRADQAFFSRETVRLPEHGKTDNLVGRDWPSDKAQ